MQKISRIIIFLSLLITVFILSACAGGGTAPDSNPDAMTQWNIPRGELLIAEFQIPVDNPGQFNTFMIGTSTGSGIHQLMSAMMWEIDTVTGEQFGEVAYGFPISNEDFTHHIINIRQGIYWSDGMPLTARDVAFTMNMIRNTPAIGASEFYYLTFYSIEAIDDWTVEIITRDPFPRLALTFGVTIWGNTLRIVPEHIYSQVEDVTTFRDENPVVAGPYTVHSWDPLGNWILFQRREDWQRSTVGVVTGRMPQAEWVLFRSIGDDSTRQMAIINNEVDILVEVTPEMLNVMVGQNPNISAWYNQFPYATSDDPAAKGLTFNHMVPPFDNRYFRWGMALAINFDDVSLAIFDGAGRSSPYPAITATAAFLDNFHREGLLPWLEEFYITLADGTVIFPYDREYAHRMADILRERGYDLPTEPAALYQMFGYGTWVHDPEAATQLFQMAGLELINGSWYFEGQPFSIEFSYLADTEIQAGRGVIATFNQMQQFGFNATLVAKTGATWATDGGTGNFEVAGYWPFGFITRDIFAQIQAWDNELITPIGVIGAGQDARWDNEQASQIIRDLAMLHPDDPRSHELAMEFIQVAIYDMPTIGFHSGVKFVPTNSTYWTNFPSSQNPYNGPWWWWSVFKYILLDITPVYN